MLAALLANLPFSRRRVIDHTLARRASGGARPGRPPPLSIDERRLRLIEIKTQKKRKQKLLDAMKPPPAIAAPLDFGDEPIPMPQDFPLQPPSVAIKFREAKKKSAFKFKPFILKDLTKAEPEIEISAIAKATVKGLVKPDVKVIDLAKVRRERERERLEQQRQETQQEIDELEAEIEELEEQEDALRQEEDALRERQRDIDERRQELADRKEQVEQQREEKKLAVIAERARLIAKRRKKARDRLRAADRKLVDVRKRDSDDEEALMIIMALLGD